MLPFPLVILVIPYLPSKLPLKIFDASFCQVNVNFLELLLYLNHFVNYYLTDGKSGRQNQIS